MMGASLFFTAATIRTFYARIIPALNIVCRVTRGAHIEHL
jgi:hypothetical protein